MSNVPTAGAVQYQISTEASGAVAAFCVLSACVPATPFHVGLPPARFVAPLTFKIRTRTVSVALVVAEAVIGLATEEARARTVVPKLWAI
jgi:hypothetical protein